MLIAGKTTERGRVAVLDQEWVDTSVETWKAAEAHRPDHVTVDLSTVDFLDFFSWIQTVALTERLIRVSAPVQLDFDFVGRSAQRLISYSEIREVESGHNPRSYEPADLEFSRRRHRVAGFAKSLGTSRVLGQASPESRVLFPGFADSLSGFYSRVKPTVILGLHRISTERDCLDFLKGENIRAWRAGMERRFQESTLFRSDEVWRVFCHELALNIVEHSDHTGFLAARVVEKEGRSFPDWLEWSFSPLQLEALHDADGGFLEVCVADAGRGLSGTLSARFHELRGEDESSAPDLLAFAFDELGTSKPVEARWATGRHALFRILNLVARYGGTLALRSGVSEVGYVPMGRRLRRAETGGFIPDYFRELAEPIPGVHLQVTIPLTPTRPRRPYRGRSLLETALPESFATEDRHVRGHLIPVRDVLPTVNPAAAGYDPGDFRSGCERVAGGILTRRPREEPLVLDFSEIEWLSSQLGDFLYFFENVLQSRASLLVEVDRELVLEFKERAYSGDYSETAAVHAGGSLETGATFYDGYVGTRSPLLVIDETGKLHILALPGPEFEAPLIETIYSPTTIESIVASHALDRHQVNAFFNSRSNLFQESRGKWECVWNEPALLNEMSRALSRHFDDVAARLEAWRGRDKVGSDSPELFYLPWSDEWRSVFLDTSRLFSRGRVADEIAQRLINRLQIGLEGDLGGVSVLAGVTAPAVSLAAALHRWWPSRDKPAVTDLGHYVFLSDALDLPAIAREGQMILVQDVVDTGHFGQQIVRALERQGASVACLLGFVQFDAKISAPVLSRPAKGWASGREDQELPQQALLRVPRPGTVDTPGRDVSEEDKFWVEPRSFRPVRFTTLRREFPEGRDPDLDRRDEFLSEFDAGDDGCLVAHGHFVYGHRHFSVVPDIRRIIEGQTGQKIAEWIADVCVNHETRAYASWEGRGRKLRGGVTAVLMPLHSQIHYIWPRVEQLLAQRGRRQPAWLLEATLFTGPGPGYKVPHQFRYQIDRALLSGDRLRLLVLDDNLVTGRTADTILSTLIHEVRKRRTQLGTHEGALEWVRYFSIISQADYSSHQVRRTTTCVGEPPFDVVFEEFAPFMGVQVHSERSCPTCEERRRLHGLRRACVRNQFPAGEREIAEYLRDSVAVAIDGPSFRDRKRAELAKPLSVLVGTGRAAAKSRVFRHADSAIWRFLELMNLGYPPSEVLASLSNAWPEDAAGEVDSAEYTRYRWAVIEWSIRNWRRLQADSATERLGEVVREEVRRASGLVERSLATMGPYHFEPEIRDLVKWCVEELRSLEGRRPSDRRSRGRAYQALKLETGLALFFLGARAAEQVPGPTAGRKVDQRDDLIDHLEEAAASFQGGGASLLGNLARRLAFGREPGNLRLGLELLAESLSRGRDKSAEVAGGSHQLMLPRMVQDVLKGYRKEEDWRLLHGAVALFKSSLQTLAPFFTSAAAERVRETCDELLELLESGANLADLRRDGLPLLRRLSPQLKSDGALATRFRRAFQPTVEEVCALLKKSADRQFAEEPTMGDRLELETEIEKGEEGARLLAPVQFLVQLLENRMVDHARGTTTHTTSKLVVRPGTKTASGVTIELRVLTAFADATTTQSRLLTSRGASGEEYLMSAFGTEVGNWERPTDAESEEEFSAAQTIIVPAGFRRRGVAS